MGGGGKGGGEFKWRKFLASMDWGVALGPITSFNRIRYKDKVLWQGPDGGTRDHDVSKKKLFGGEKEEGGVYGVLEFYLGTAAQLASTELANRYGTTPATESGQQGLAHVFFRGYGGRGFLWQANNPYFSDDLEFSITAVESSLSGEPRIWPINGVDGSGNYEYSDASQVYDADGRFQPRNAPDKNPAHIVYDELILAGYDAAELNDDSFLAAAQTFRDEDFGLSVGVFEDSTPETVIQEVLDHVRAALVQDRATGIVSLKLFRADYVAADLVLFDDSNAELVSLKVASPSELSTKVKVEYLDPENEESVAVEATLDGREPQEENTRLEPKEYHLIRNPWLAAKVAIRDLHELSQPLAGATIEISRQHASMAEGDVVRFAWAPKNFPEKVYRVVKVKQGASNEGSVRLDLVEDFLSNPAPAAATSIDYYEEDEPGLSGSLYAFSAPYLFSQKSIEAATIFYETTVDESYPAATVMLTYKDTTATPLVVYADAPNVVGDVATREIVRLYGEQPTTLSSPLAAEAHSTISYSDILAMTGGDLEGGMFFVIGDDENTHEIILLSWYDFGLQEWTVMRGCLDTVPSEWSAGTPVFPLIPTIDPNVRAPGSAITYYVKEAATAEFTEIAEWVAFRDGIDTTGLDSTTYTPNYRFHQPYRPANVQIGGNGFDTAIYGLTESLPTDITVTWANRNRLTEDAVVLAWDDGSVTPESGQTTTVQFYDDLTDTLEHEETGLTGSSVTVALSNLTDYRYYRVEVFSVNAPGAAPDLESFRRVVRYMEIWRSGYGNIYGYNYGGGTEA